MLLFVDHRESKTASGRHQLAYNLEAAGIKHFLKCPDSCETCNKEVQYLGYCYVIKLAPKARQSHLKLRTRKVCRKWLASASDM